MSRYRRLRHGEASDGPIGTTGTLNPIHHTLECDLRQPLSEV